MQDEDDVQLMMSGDEDRRTTQDKLVKSIDPVKLEKQLRSDKIDDCQKSPSRFARFTLLRRFTEQMYNMHKI